MAPVKNARRVDFSEGVSCVAVLISTNVNVILALWLYLVRPDFELLKRGGAEGSG